MLRGAPLALSRVEIQLALSLRLWALPAQAATAWPGNLEASAGLPRALLDGVDARAEALKAGGLGKLKVTVYEADEAAGDAEGDIVVYGNAEGARVALGAAAEQQLGGLLDGLAQSGHLPGGSRLEGPAIFVCAHAKKDKRCGACGPALVTAFRAQLQARGLAVPVRGCSHVGGHAYAGNVIVFSSPAGVLRGEWFGYVTPEDVAAILDQHLTQGLDLPRLWRGRMGMPPEEHAALAKAALQRLGAPDACGDAADCDHCEQPCVAPASAAAAEGGGVIGAIRSFFGSGSSSAGGAAAAVRKDDDMMKK